MTHMTAVKSVKNATLFDNGCIKIENVRFSYPHVDKPFKSKDPKDAGKQPKYGVKAMLKKDTHAEAKQLIVDAMNELLRKNDNATVAKDKKFIRNGDDLDNELYLGHWIVSANEEVAPSARDEKFQVVTDPERLGRLFQGGHWGDVLIRPWFQDGKTSGAGFGKRVNANLVGIRFARTDKTFGESRIDDTTAWSAPGDDDTGDDPMASASTYEEEI